MRRFFNRSRWELITLVTVKAMLFYLIWLCFFSHPAAENMDDQKMVSRLVTPLTNKISITKTDTQTKTQINAQTGR